MHSPNGHCTEVSQGSPYFPRRFRCRLVILLVLGIDKEYGHFRGRSHQTLRLRLLPSVSRVWRRDSVDARTGIPLHCRDVGKTISNLTCSLAPECYYERYVHPVCDVYSLAAFAISLFKSGPVYRPEEINGLCTSAALLEAVVNQGFRPAIPGCVPEGMLSGDSC